MQLEHLPPKEEIKKEYPLKIKNLIDRINDSKSIDNTKIILSRFYTLNSKDEQVKKIYSLLSYDPKTKTFSKELNKNFILDLIKNEYLSDKNQEMSENYEEKNFIVPKSSFILPNQNTFEIKNDFNNLLTNSVKNDLNLNSFNSKLNLQSNILENNFLEKKATFTLSETKKDDVINEKPLKQKRKRRTTESNEKNNPQKKLKKSPTDEIYTVQPQQVRNNSYGLKEISNRVREIIKRNGQTSYKEISDEIVSEINQQGSKDEKNIRRRIYDSLNVMKSMKLFKKDKNSKKIVWNFNEDANILDDDNNDNFNNLYNEYLNELKTLNEKIKEFYNKNNIKRQKYNALNLELLSLQSILERNKRPNMENIEESKKIYFPFVIIEFPEKLNSSNEGKIKIAMNESRTKAHFGFDSANRLYGDLDAITKIIQNNNSLNENNNNY